MGLSVLGQCWEHVDRSGDTVHVHAAACLDRRDDVVVDPVVTVILQIWKRIMILHVHRNDEDARDDPEPPRVATATQRRCFLDAGDC